MTQLKNDILMEKVILFLILLVGTVLIYNQFQFTKFLSGTILNFIAYALVLGLIAVIVMLFLKKEISSGHHDVFAQKSERKPFTFHEKLSWGFVSIILVLVLFSQAQISQVDALVSGTSSPLSSFAKSVSTPLKLGSGKGGVVVGPQLNSDGRTTILVEWPTISETPAPKDSGNPTQDAINTVIPVGTPFYVLEGQGSERVSGATFDDPITSQKVWASLLGSRRFGTKNEIQLTPEEEQRWQKLTSVFTCDFCCGGPSSVTTISRCGCAHSYAWQGMAKFFIKYYPEYTDEEILGEMTKWKGLWYPQGMIQDYLVYTGQQSADILTHGGSIGIKQQFLQQGSGPQQTHVQVTPLDNLPSMVGGC